MCITMLKLLRLLCLFWNLSSMESGSHTLWLKAMLIIGQTPFPEFMVYLMLDDIEFALYNSEEQKTVHRDIHNDSGSMFDGDKMDYGAHFMGIHERMENRLLTLRKYLNHTKADIYILQRASRCVLDNGRPGVMISEDAYNGETVVVEHYDADHDALRIDWTWPDSEDKEWTQKMNFPWRYRMIYHPDCINYLKKHLVKEKNRVLKQVAPRVRFFLRKLPESADVLITCFVTGFYPRHINLTLLSDGQPVSDQQLTGGELLPNGDETYQMRKSLKLCSEELQHHHYTCTIEHLSLNNSLEKKMIINLEHEWDTVTSTAVADACLVGVIACLVVIAICCKRRTCSGQGPEMSQMDTYTAAPGTEPDQH